MKVAKDIIVFLGKFDNELLLFENNIYNMIRKEVDNQNSDIKFEYNSKDPPNIKKYTIENIDFWITLGAAKPTVLLKSLLTRSTLLFLIFNFSSEETLFFLKNGWGRIIKEIVKKDTQKWILVGTQPDINHCSEEKIQLIINTMETLKCDAYFDEEMLIKSPEISIIENLFEYIQNQIQFRGSDEFLIEKEQEEEEGNTKDKKRKNIFIKTNKNFIYNLNQENKTIELSEAKSAEGDIKIPKFFTLNGEKYSITKICDYAFQNSSIQSLSFEDDSEVSQIGDYAFQGSQIRKIVLPSSLKNLSKYWCGGAEYLDEIDVDDKNQQFYFLNGFLIHENEQVPEILFAPRDLKNLSNDRFEIQFNIGSYAFYKNERIRLIVSKSEDQTINIGDYSFFGSKDLQKINFNNKEINIGDNCFSESTKLQSIEIKSILKFNIGQNCFENCSSLTTIILNNESEENLTIPSKAFKGCKSLQTIKIKTKSRLILSNDLFAENTKLQTVELTGNDIQLCDKCFNKSFNKSFNKYEPNNIRIISQTEVEIGPECFSESNITNIELEGLNIKLKERSFNKCMNLETITISNSNEIIIDKFTFNECQNLTNITLNQIKYIKFDNQVFSGCKQLNYITISKTTKLTPIEHFEIITTPHKRMNSIFINNKNTNELYFTKILKEKSESDKWDESERFLIDRIILISKENNPTISTEFHLYFFTHESKQCYSMLTKSYSNGTLEKILKSKQLTGTQKYIIAIGIILGLQYLQSLNINNLSLRPSKIFLDEKYYPILNEVIFCNSNKRTIYDSPEILQGRRSTFKTYIYSFSLILYEIITCKEISQFKKEITNGNNPDLQSIENPNIRQFIKKCMSKYSFERPEINEIIDEITSEKYINLFKADENEIHNYLTLFDKNDITKQIEQDNLSYIIFKRDKRATIQSSQNNNHQLEIPEYIIYQGTQYNITKINNYSFLKSKLTEIIFPKNIEIIGKRSFYESTNIQTITFQSPNITIGESSFENCTSLETINFSNPNSINFGINSFKNCKHINQILTSETNSKNSRTELQELKIGNNSFEGCESLQIIIFKAENITIRSEPFKNCYQLENISIIQSSYTYFYNDFFSVNNIIKYIEIQSKEISFNNNLFDKCLYLESIIIDSDIKCTIPSNAFKGCKSLQTIKIKTKSRLILSNDLFAENTKLQTVELTGNDIQLCDKCFNKSFNKSFNKYEPNNINIISQTEVEIGPECFSESNITKVELEGLKIKLKERSFNKCMNLETITISNSNEIIIDKFTFNECQNLTNITLNQIKYIKFDNQVFSGCKQLNYITISKTTKLTPIEHFEIITTPHKRMNSIFINNKNTNELYFTKILKEKSESDKWDESERFLIDQIILISKENNPTISTEFQLCFFIYDKKQYFVKLTKYRKETLSTAIQNNRLTGTQKYIIALGIILGLQYLQSLNINNLSLISSQIHLDEKQYPILNDIIQWNYITTSFKAHTSSYSSILYEIITGKGISNENHQDLQSIEDPNIRQFIKKCMSKYSFERPEINEIIDEITSEKYINLFKADENEIHNYLTLFDKNDITEQIEQDNLSYIIFKREKRSTIQSSQNNNHQLEIPEYIIYQGTRFNITKIGTHSFYESNNLRTITIRSSNITIGESSFENCTSLETINFSNPNSINFGINSFKNCKHINQIFTSETKPINIELNKSCFSNLKKLIFLEIECQKLKIGMNSFENCKTLKTVFLKAETISIFQEPFKKCQQLENMSIFNASSIKCDDNFFSTIKNLKTINIQVNEFKIKDNLFDNCSSLNSINIQTNEDIKITSNTFKGCKSLITIKLKSLNSIELSNECFNDNDNYIIESIEIESQTVKFGKRCFYNSEKLQKISIESKEITIDEYCFTSCKELSLISFQNLNTTTIGTRAFLGCNNIKIIDINSSTKIEIGSYCFSLLTNLEKIKLSSEEINILDNCFKKCAKLTAISIENSKSTKFKSYAFSDCIKLENISIDSSSTIEIDDYCFSEAKSLQKITLNSETIKIKQHCFNNCSNLSSISFNEVKDVCIGSYAFSGCNKLTQFKLHTLSKLKVCKYCFSGATNLHIVELLSNNIIISEWIFLGLESISSVSVQSFQTHNISKDAFKGITKEQLKLSLNGMEKNVFDGKKSIH